MTPKGLRSLPAVGISAVAIDRAAEQCPNGTAKDRAEGPVAIATGDFAACERTDHTAYEQACGAVALAAVIIAVASTPNLRVAIDRLAIIALLLAIAAVIITTVLIATVAIAATVPAAVVFE